MSNRIKTRFLLLSDTHARAPNPPEAKTLPCRWPLPSADVAIHTGDLTLNGKIEQHEQAIDVLKRLQADLKIVIPGNHDLTLDTSYYAEYGVLHGPWPKYDSEQLQYIRDLYTGPESRDANIVYLEEGTQSFTLNNGATLTVYASAYTAEFCDWAFAYPRDQDRFNPPHAANAVASYDDNKNLDKNESDNNIDVMLTHGPPHGILDAVPDRKNPGRPELHAGCEHLFRAVSRARPLLHCFGHIHEGWGAVRKSWALTGKSHPTTTTDNNHDDQLDPWWSSPTTDSKPTTAPSSTSTSVPAPMHIDQDKTILDRAAYVDLTTAQRGEETLFVNSSIMDARYGPTQAPWVVDLMLPPARVQEREREREQEQESPLREL